MDIWGHCGTCDRWFYCPTVGPDDPRMVDLDGTRHQAAVWSCPVCGAEPTEIENRAARPRRLEA